MKGTFSRYDEKTGKAAITPVADTAGQGFSFGASAGQFLTAKEFKFRGKRGRIYLNREKGTDLFKLQACLALDQLFEAL